MKKYWQKMPMMAPEGGGMGDGGSGAQAAAGAQVQQQMPTTAQQNAQTQDAQPQETPEMRYDTLINGELKEVHNARMKTTVENRVKGLRGQLTAAQQAQQQYQQRMQPIMDTLAQRYGLQADDLDGIAEHVRNDDAMYAEEAAKRGMPVSSYKQLQQLQAENNRMKMQQQQQEKQAQMQQHFGRMQMQAQEMQQTFPGFDLMTELENPTFARLTSPDVGMSLMDAYFAVHHEEIQKASMQYATQQAMMAASQAVQSGTMRPAENGNKPQGPINTSIDPSTWGKKELAQLEKQMRKNGGRVYLG